MEQESERIGKDAMECQIIADDAEADLAVAMPALEKAMLEVDKLDKTSITEARLTRSHTLPRFFFYRTLTVSSLNTGVW